MEIATYIKSCKKQDLFGGSSAIGLIGRKADDAEMLAISKK